MPEAETPAPTLHRVLGPIGVMLLAFSALSPAFSVYIGGDAVLHMAGTGAAIAFILGGVATAIVGLLYAEIGAAFPAAGGVYPSLAALLGPLFTFPYIVLLAPLVVAGTAFAALGLADYVRVLMPGAPLLPVTFAALVFAAVIAVLNIRSSALVTGAFLAVEAIALATLSVVALIHPSRSLGAVLAHPVMLSHGALVATPLTTMGLAVVSGVWATGGAGWVLYFAEEMRDARKRIGRVVAWTGVIASITIAGPMVLMLLSVNDSRAMLAAEAPIATYLRMTGGPLIAILVSAGVAAAIFHALVASVMGYSRYLFASGRDGIWPRPVNAVLSVIHPRLRTPINATVVLVVASAAAVFLGEKALLVLISGNVSDYVLISLAIFVGRRRGTTGQTFRAPLHPMIPVFGLVVAVLSVIADWMDPDAGRPSIILLLGLFLGAMAYYHFRLRQVSKGWLVMAEVVETVEIVEVIEVAAS